MQKEQYLITCGRYIERNPVKAGMVEFAELYPYSSAQFYCLGKTDGITHESPLFVSFGKEIISRQSNYREFLRNFNVEDEESFGRIEEPLGNKEFLSKLIKENGRYLPRRKGKARKY